MGEKLGLKNMTTVNISAKLYNDPTGPASNSMPLSNIWANSSYF
jgi:hypothetical protein